MLTLGGDHFISYPLLQAHAEKHGSLSMIHFDAHHDTESDGDEKRIDFDIDCLDPAFAPGTGTPVCGGLSTFHAFEILRGLRGINVIGMDVVEVAPAHDHAEITALAASALAMEMICLYAARHKL